MNKILKICMMAAIVLGFTSCYNDFDDPAPAKVWTEEDFANENFDLDQGLQATYSTMYTATVPQV